MPNFTYTALDPGGRQVRGRMEADSEQVVLTRLHEQRFHVLSVGSAKAGAQKVGVPTSSKGVKLNEMVLFSRQFATMIDAGIAIVRCLDILETQTRDQVLRPVIAQCKRDVKGGMSLTDAFSKHPRVFSRLYVNMVRAAETGGILDKILDRLAQFLEKEQEVRGKIKSAMIYPVMVLIFACFMVVALFMFVLPKFKEIFDSMEITLPATTKFLFSLSSLLVHYWFVPLGTIVALFFGYRWYRSTENGAWQIDMLKLKAPIIGDLVQKMSISRFSRTFATLIASGVAMMRSLEIVAETSGNRVLAKAIDASRNAIREGQTITAPLTQSGLFPPMVTHMIDIGEETGRLSEMLTKVSDFYDMEVDNAVKGLTSLIEPMLIIMMGGIVGFIAIAIMGPMFDMIGQMSNM